MKLFSAQGVKFNGNNSNCIIDGNISEVAIRNQMTLRIRFKVISSAYPYDFLIKDNEYKLGINSSGNIVFSVWDGTDWEPSVVGAQAQLNNWYDVICIFNIGSNNINKSMYINNIDNEYSEISQSGSISQTTNNLIIGNSNIIVDNLSFWYRILGEDEIELIFDGGMRFGMLGFWLAFEDINIDNTNETKEVVYKRYIGQLNNIEIVDGKEME